MAAVPLTHHEILSLVEPYTRSGRHVDLSATDRIERRIVFRSFELTGGRTGSPSLRESLTIENPEPGRFRLMRSLEHASGLTATLQVDAREFKDLLTRAEEVPPERQFQVVAGVPVARSYRIERNSLDGRGVMRAAAPVLLRAAARLPGLKLTLESRDNPGGPALLELATEGEKAPRLPEDFLAVLGWHWRPLKKTSKGWRTGIWAASREPARTRDLEARLARTVAHMAESLAAPPERFHRRFLWARWMVVQRRALVLLFALALLGAGPGIGLLDVPEGSILRLLAFSLPPTLLVLIFVAPELPTLSPPPIPRPLAADSWRPERIGSASLG